jgi:SAM-dependent methyltransferase
MAREAHRRAVSADDAYLAANRRHWDEVVPIHVASAFYDVAGFKAGAERLASIERREVGDVRGRTLLHLQCHFGMDTIAWARDAGAVVTGADFSAPAIEAARRLAAEMDVPARFVCAELSSLPDVLEGQFDVVFTSYGVLGWLPDLGRWARVAAHFVRPGGVFYIAEFHPFAWIFDDAPGTTALRVRHPYFPAREPLRDESPGTYADTSAPVGNRLRYNFPYTLADTVTSLVAAGLRIEFLHEFPWSPHRCWPFTVSGDDGTARLREHDGSVPLIFSIKATKP